MDNLRHQRNTGTFSTDQKQTRCLQINLQQSMKIEDQQDVTIRCLLLTSVSTCFGHHDHLQENKGPVTAFGVLFWFCWMWLVAVDGRCIAGCEHYSFRLL